jgi:leucyl/phenylalanyl-tRNA--protein transferase
MPVFILSDDIRFPPPHLAVREGLLAVGGDLSLDRLVLAYREGIFPWFSEGDPILWWSPDPRMVLFPAELRLSASLRKTIRRGYFRLTMDAAFERVVHACARVKRPGQDGTWITRSMAEAYIGLYEAGYAHSMEAWKGGALAGGLYGVSLGSAFFGESMFTRISNASKVALAGLVGHLRMLSFDLVDCQVRTAHLAQFGARDIPRRHFLKLLARSQKGDTLKGRWRLHPEALTAAMAAPSSKQKAS